MTDAAVLGITGLFIFGCGIAIWRGRTELLAQYAEKDGPKGLATRAGGILTAYGLFTIGLAFVTVQIGESAILLGSWMILTMVIGFGVAVLAANSD